MKKDSQKSKHPIVKITLLSIIVVVIVAGMIFMRFGGFGTGESLDTKELSAYAKK